MKVNLNCCAKPSLFNHKPSLTLFKGEGQPAEVKSQPTQDTFVKSEKAGTPAAAAEVKPACVGDACKK